MSSRRAALRYEVPVSRPGSGSAVRLPGRPPFPALDDHLVEPEVTRDEVVGGRWIIASPAHEPHASQHTDLDYLVRAHAAPGYQVATDLITRFDESSDFATDVCVYRRGIDAATGGRYLEEMAFEVVSSQNRKVVTEKARRMHRRGVRRIFGVWARDRQIREWSPADGWCPLAAEARIEDPCLTVPLAVSAVLDAAAADDAVAQALIAKGNPVLRKREDDAEARGEIRGRAEGRAAGLAEAILEILAVRGISVEAGQREQILGCRDLERMQRWLPRAAVAVSVDEVLSLS